MPQVMGDAGYSLVSELAAGDVQIQLATLVDSGVHRLMPMSGWQRPAVYVTLS